VASAWLLACSPSLNWRIVPLDNELSMHFPCKVQRRDRLVPIEGLGTRPMSQWACEADGWTFVLNRAEAPGPQDLRSMADALQRATEANVGRRVGEPVAVPWPRALGEGGSRRVHLQSESGAARAVHAQMLSFERGSAVYQAAVVASNRPPDAVVNTFFESLAPR
jgi:hypothetical protein